MNVVYKKLETEDEWRWITVRLPILWVSDMAGIVAVDADKNIRVGAFVAGYWTKNSCSGNIIVDNNLLLKHGFVEEIVDWVFGSMGCRFMIANVLENNEKSMKLTLHIGFEEKAYIPDLSEDGIGIRLMVLDRDKCKYFSGA